MDMWRPCPSHRICCVMSGVCVCVCVLRNSTPLLGLYILFSLSSDTIILSGFNLHSYILTLHHRTLSNFSLFVLAEPLTLHPAWLTNIEVAHDHYMLIDSYRFVSNSVTLAFLQHYVISYLSSGQIAWTSWPSVGTGNVSMKDKLQRGSVSCCRPLMTLNAASPSTDTSVSQNQQYIFLSRTWNVCEASVLNNSHSFL